MHPIGLPAVVTGAMPAHLSTGSVVGDVLLGVGVALVLFALYYRFVLDRARRSPRQRSGAGDTD